jgi:hypothetical protein
MNMLPHASLLLLGVLCLMSLAGAALGGLVGSCLLLVDGFVVWFIGLSTDTEAYRIGQKSKSIYGYHLEGG